MTRKDRWTDDARSELVDRLCQRGIDELSARSIVAAGCDGQPRTAYNEVCAELIADHKLIFPGQSRN